MEKAEHGQKRVFFFLVWPWWSQKQEARAETHRGPGQLAEHLDLAWELLNWRRRGRTRRAKAVLGGGGWRQAEGFVKIVMPTFGDFLFSRLRPVRFVTRSAGLFLFPGCCAARFAIFLLPQALWAHPLLLSPLYFFYFSR